MAAMATPRSPATPHWTLVAIAAFEEPEVEDALGGWPIPNVGPLEEGVVADAAAEGPLLGVAPGVVGLVDRFKQAESAGRNEKGKNIKGIQYIPPG
jgi:hypothetical protein